MLAPPVSAKCLAENTVLRMLHHHLTLPYLEKRDKYSGDGIFSDLLIGIFSSNTDNGQVFICKLNSSGLITATSIT